MLHYQHAVHQLWSSSVHMQCPRIDGVYFWGLGDVLIRYKVKEENM